LGCELNWHRLETKTASRIFAEVNGGSFRDEAGWEEMQSAMVSAMHRLESATAPYVKRYRRGEKPNSSYQA
jgi:hypothetical protein